MFEAVAMMGGLGLIVGVGLAVASKVFYVYVDPLILRIDEVLPGANCGGCGMPGCSANAEAIATGKSSPSSCVAAGPDVAAAIAAILGVSVEAKEPDIARPGCYYGTQDADLKYAYDGMPDCRAAALLSGGMKVCSIGCLGLGTCVRACPFNAITMGPENLPVVDEKKCTGCGTCERVCPKNIITLSSVTRRILREYTAEECTTPCQRSCPAGIDIREYIHQISMGNPLKAVQVIKERNPFPSVIGRICPRPCESDCRRKLVDEPVAINFLKRYAADYEREQGHRILPYRAPETGRKVVVVGGGVEGLSAAFFAARIGHEVTVYEASDTLGGLLRSAIASYRLPSDILDWDIAGILEMGVRAETGKVLGRDITVDEILAGGAEAVFLASGGWDSRLARGGKSDQPVPDTLLMVDFLKETDKGASVLVGENAVIVGGGSLAVEAARRCKSLGARKALIVYREGKDALGSIDVDALAKEGIDVHFGSGIGRLFGRGKHLSHVELVGLESGSRTSVSAHVLILAAGRFPELIFVPEATLAELAESESATESQETEKAPEGPIAWAALAPYKKPADKDQLGFFSKGDVFTDFSAAIRAIAAGRRGAASLHQVMYRIPLSYPERVITGNEVLQDVDQVQDVSPVKRNLMPLCQDLERQACKEIEKGFDSEAAQNEAGRCLQCGLICYQHTVQEPPQETV